MEDAILEATQYMKNLQHTAPDKLASILDYVSYVHDRSGGYPLDDYDYELARRAGEPGEGDDDEILSWEEAMDYLGAADEVYA